MQKILSHDKVVILVDYREKKSLVVDYLKEMNGLVKTIPLKVGDYLLSDRTVIEKKTANDFVASIIDGRLFKQAEELKDNFDKPIIIIEGRSFNTNMNANAIKGAIAYVLLEKEIPILMTEDEKDTARTIYWLAKREQKLSKRQTGIKGRKKPKTLKKLQEHILSGFPGVSIVLSKRILSEFKTIKNFVNSEEGEILKIDGIGKKLAKRLRIILNKEYEESE